MLGRKLSVQLVMAVIVAMVLAYVSFPLFNRLSYAVVESSFASPEAIAQNEQRYVWLLQEFIVDNNITIENISLLNTWVAGADNIRLTLFANNLIFDSEYESRIFNDPNMIIGDEAVESWYLRYLDKQYISLLIREQSSSIYQVIFADGTYVNALVHSEVYATYYMWAYYVSMGLSVLLFILLCLIAAWIKMRYLQTLSRELEILKGGDLSYNLHERGHDELFDLAHGINQMRLSLLAKKQEEEENAETHQKLMTALAHDLRTPLTSLIGYLELLLLKHYQDEEQLKHFLGASKRKAFQIREMSDKLFEYFLATEMTAETYHKEAVKTQDLITGLIDNQMFDLESSGFEVKLYAQLDSFNGECMIDAEFLQRVLDNTLSNINKYADRNHPLELMAFETDSFLHIEFTNILDPRSYSNESTALGLRTCMRIMQEHGGSYQGFTQGFAQGKKFISRLILPLMK